MLLAILLTWQMHAIRAQGMRKTMLEQLAALRGYIITAEQGYRIAEDGLHLVRDIKSGEFNLHQVFFQSLKTVDEGVLQYPALDRSYGLVAAIDKAFSQAMPVYASSKWLQPDELQYIQGLRQRVADQGRDDRAALQALTQSDALSMTDGERIGRIRAIVTALQARYSQVNSFLNGVTGLIYQRQKEQAFTETLKKWYGIQ